VSVTASQLERALACPGSFALPSARTASVYTEQGTSGHAEQEDAVNTGALPEPLLRVLADAADTARAEVKLAYNVATGEGRILGQGSDRDYEDLGPFWMYGTADVLAFDFDSVYVVDKKLWQAVTPAARNMQLGFLALAAARALNKSDAVVALIYETERVDKATLDMVELDTIAFRLRGVDGAVQVQRSRRARGELVEVSEGAWCKHCPAAHSCPAKVALIKRLVNGGEADELELMIPLDDETARIAYERVGHARNLLKRIESAIYARAAEKPIPLGGGRFLGKHVENGDERLNGRIAHRVLADLVSIDAADEAVDYEVTKTAIKEAIKKRAPKGSAARTEREVLAAIRERGGAKRETKERIGEFIATLGLVASEKAG
jgi:hypothetical protein